MKKLIENLKDLAGFALTIIGIYALVGSIRYFSLPITVEFQVIGIALLVGLPINFINVYAGLTSVRINTRYLNSIQFSLINTGMWMVLEWLDIVKFESDQTYIYIAVSIFLIHKLTHGKWVTK